MGEHELFNGVFYYDPLSNHKFYSDFAATWNGSISNDIDACTSVMPGTSITVSSSDLASCTKTGSNYNRFSIEEKFLPSSSPILTGSKASNITYFDEDIKEDEAMDLHPVKIIFNDPVSVVFWEDGEKTVVRRHKGEPYDKYVAFCAALAIKIFGSNTEVNRIVSNGIDQQEKDQKKAEKKGAKK